MRQYLIFSLVILLSVGAGAHTLTKFSTGVGSVQAQLNATERAVFVILPQHSIVLGARLGVSVIPTLPGSETEANLTVNGSRVWGRSVAGQVREDVEIDPGLFNRVMEDCLDRECTIGLTLYSSSSALLVLSQLEIKYQQPDLVLKNLATSSASAPVGEVLLIRAIVSNTNVSEMRDIEVEFYKNAISARNLISLYTIPVLEAGAEQSVNTFLSVDWDLNKIICVLDRKDSLGEANESNNLQSVDIEVVGEEQDPGLSPIGPVEGPEDLLPSGGRKPLQAPLDPTILLLFFGGLFLTIVVAVLLISKSIGKRKSFVLPIDIYTGRKESIYSIKRMLSPNDKEVIYTAFHTPYEFLVHKPLKGGTQKFAQKLVSEYNIPKDYAEAIALAKKTGSTLLIDSKQAWVRKIVEGLGLNSKLMI